MNRRQFVGYVSAVLGAIGIPAVLGGKFRRRKYINQAVAISDREFVDCEFVGCSFEGEATNRTVVKNCELYECSDIVVAKGHEPVITGNYFFRTMLQHSGA